MKKLLTLFAFILCIVAFVDVFIFRYRPVEIYAGQRIVYWSHVEQMARAWFAFPALGFFAIWFFLRKLYKPLDWVNWQSMSLFMIAALLFTVIAPLGAVTHIARHLQSVSTPSQRYQLYYQYEGIAAENCDYVLLRCDNLGLACQYIERWEIAPQCLGTNAPIELFAEGETIRVEIFGKIVFSD